MLRTVAVPLDGSDLAERALPYAVRLAQVRHGQLLLLRSALAAPPSGCDWERQQVAAVEEAEQYLAGLAERLSPHVPVVFAVPYGRAPVEILEAVRRFGADVVVMATHGRTGVAHLLYGSVAEAVLATSTVPVFLVQARAGEAAAAPFDPAAARLLVPLDGSAFAEAALPVAVEFLGPTGKLVLVRIVAPAEHAEGDERGQVIAYLDQVQAALEREAIDYLRAVARRLAQDYPGIQVRTDIRVGDPAGGIAAVALDRLADLIVMATHGRTGLRRAVLGSATGAVLRASSTSLLLVRPPRPSDQQTKGAETVAPGMVVTF